MPKVSVFSLRLGVLAVQLYWHFQRLTPLHPLQRHPNMHAVAAREQSTALSGTSRASTLHFVLIQRLPPSHPPAISAEIMQNLQ